MMKKMALGIIISSFLAGLSMASEGELVYKRCIGCHGFHAEKKALDMSQVIQGWPAERVRQALRGYQEGSYGGRMKSLMRGQASPLGDEEIDALGAYIESLKEHAPR